MPNRIFVDTSFVLINALRSSNRVDVAEIDKRLLTFDGDFTQAGFTVVSG